MKQLITIIAILFSLNSFSQTLAFPCAYGAGAYTTGGRGGSVSIVTNLNDNGAGSLRSFANVSNTTIIFNISGVINLTTTLSFTGNNVTIAGQTAPQGGITIDGARVIFQNSDQLICRHIRFRGGHHENNDAVGGYYLNDVIFDHCSFSFGGDEALSIIVDTPIETGGNITVQNCVLAESSTGGIMGGDEAPSNVFGISMIRNVFYNITHRFPNVNSNSRYDVVNNYIHNHSKRMIRGNFGYQLNEIGNLYDFGSNRVWDETLNHHGCNLGENLPTIYTTGNTIFGTESWVGGETVTSTIPQMNTNNTLMWRYFYDNNSDCGLGLKNRGDQLEPSYFTNTQFTFLGNASPILNTSQLLTQIVPTAGASKRLNSDGSVSNNLDVLDSNWLSQIENGNYIPKMLQANYAVPAITSITRSAGYDTDNDGMADLWETNTFGHLSRDGTLDFNNDGYTDLEEFLNGVDNCQGNTTSIKLQEQDELTIYPNPTNEELTVTSENIITKIEVYNSLGAIVLSKDKLSSKTQKLLIDNLPKGVYSIKVYEVNRTIEKQIIKQ